MEEEKKEERQEEQEEQSAARREKELYRKIEEEEYNLKKFRDIQEEVNSLNRSLSDCIAIAADSIMNVSLKRRYDMMRAENHNSYVKANRVVDNAIVEKEKEINQLQEEKAELEEEKNEQKENYSNE